jgi:hypothetical protein
MINCGCQPPRQYLQVSGICPARQPLVLQNPLIVGSIVLRPAAPLGDSCHSIGGLAPERREGDPRLHLEHASTRAARQSPVSQKDGS